MSIEKNERKDDGSCFGDMLYGEPEGFCHGYGDALVGKTSHTILTKSDADYVRDYKDGHRAGWSRRVSILVEE